MSKREFAKIAGSRGTGSAGFAIASSTGTLSGTQKTIARGTNVSKYRNRKITIDGQTFDSKREAQRFQELRILERQGTISDLQTQVTFELIPSQKVAGKVAERAVKYVADFVYTEGGKKVVEDVKGVRTKEYVIKRKLMLWRHGIQVQEV